MMTVRATWAGRVLLLVALAVQGCGPRAGLLDQEAHLGYKDLERGGIAPLAAVSSDGDESLRGPLAHRLEWALRGRRDLRVLSVRDVREALGPDLHDLLIERMEQSGSLPDADIALLDSLIGARVRYVALARIEDESIDQEEASTTDAQTGITTTDRSAVLRIRVAFSVYDLEACRRVWMATIVGTDKNTASTTDESQGLAESILSSLLGLDKEYPDEPGPDAALTKIFTTFAKRLPAG